MADVAMTMGGGDKKSRLGHLQNSGGVKVLEEGRVLVSSAVLAKASMTKWLNSHY